MTNTAQTPALRDEISAALDHYVGVGTGTIDVSSDWVRDHLVAHLAAIAERRMIHSGAAVLDRITALASRREAGQIVNDMITAGLETEQPANLSIYDARITEREVRAALVKHGLIEQS